MASRKSSTKSRAKIDRPQAQNISESYELLGLKAAPKTTMRSFKNTLNDFRKSYETSKGEAGTSFRNWDKSQVELTQMAEGFLGAHGADYWPVDREWYAKGDLIHPEDGKKLLQYLKELFFMRNQNQKANNRSDGIFEVPAVASIIEELACQSRKSLPGLDSSTNDLYMNSMHDRPMSRSISPKEFIDVFDGPHSEDEIPSKKPGIPSVLPPEPVATFQKSTKCQKTKPDSLEERPTKRSKLVTFEDYSPRRTNRSQKPTKRPGFISTLSMEVTHEIDQEMKGPLLESVEEVPSSFVPYELQAEEFVSALPAERPKENERFPNKYAPEAPMGINPPASLAQRISAKSTETARNKSRRSVNQRTRVENQLEIVITENEPGIRPSVKNRQEPIPQQNTQGVIDSQVQSVSTMSPGVMLDPESARQKDLSLATSFAPTLQLAQDDASTVDQDQRCDGNSNFQPADVLDDPVTVPATIEMSTRRLQELARDNMKLKEPDESVGLATGSRLYDKQPEVPIHNPATDNHSTFRSNLLTPSTPTRQMHTPNHDSQADKHSPESFVKLADSPLFSPRPKTSQQIKIWVITRHPRYTEELCTSLKILGTSLDNFTSAISLITGSVRTISEIKIKLVAPARDTKMTVCRDREDLWVIIKEELAEKIKQARAEARREGRPAALRILIEPLYEEEIAVEALPDGEDEDVDF